jgi:hypothetical protein
MSETLAGGDHDGVDQLAVAVGADAGFHVPEPKFEGGLSTGSARARTAPRATWWAEGMFGKRECRPALHL